MEAEPGPLPSAVRISTDYGPPDDAAYRRLTRMIATTLADVGLAPGGGEASAMQMTDADRRGVVLVLHDHTYTDPDFTDALMALLGSRAPAVGWYVVPDDEDGVTVIGAYSAEMPAEAITVVT